MIVLSQTFSTRGEGVWQLIDISPTIGGLLSAHRYPHYETFRSTLVMYIERQSHPKKAREPFEGVAIKLVLTPGHLRFKSPEISVEIVPEEGRWRFTIFGSEVDEVLGQRMGWEELEEFPADDAP